MRIISPANPSTIFADTLRVSAVADGNELTQSDCQLWLRDSKSFTLFLENSKGLSSNTLEIALRPVYSRAEPLGGFVSPVASAYGAKFLLLSAWAAEAGSQLLKAEFKIGSRSILAKQIGLESPWIAASLPGLPEAERSVFATVVPLSELEGLLDKTQSLKAECQFSSGRSLEIPGRSIYLCSDYDRPQGKIEKYLLTDERNILVEGYCFCEGFEPPTLSFSLGDRTVAADRVKWSSREDINWRHLGALEREHYAFSAEVALDRIGRPPGLLKLYAILAETSAEASEKNRAPSSLNAVPIGSLGDWQALGRLCRENWPEEEVGRNAFWKFSRKLRDLGQTAAEFTQASLEPSCSLKVSSAAPVKKLSPGDRYVFVSHNLSDTQGAPKVLYNIIEGLIRAGTNAGDISLAAAQDGGLRAKLESIGVEVVLFPNLDLGKLLWSNYFKELSEFQNWLDERSAGLVFANTVDTFWALDAARSLNVPKLALLHETLSPEEVLNGRCPQIRAKCLESLESCPRVFFPAQKSRDALGSLFKPKQTRVIQNGIDLVDWDKQQVIIDRDKERSALGIAPKDRLFVCVGTVCKRKGQDILLEAFSEVLNSKLSKDKALRLIMVGGRDDDFSARLQERIAELNLTEQVQILPEDHCSSKYFSIADYVCLPSRQESFPLVTLEAMASAKPLICSKVGGIPDQVGHEEEALLVEAEDVQQLAEAMSLLASSPDLATRLGRAARSKAEKEFPQEKSIAEFVKEISIAG